MLSKFLGQIRSDLRICKLSMSQYGQHESLKYSLLYSHWNCPVRRWFMGSAYEVLEPGLVPVRRIH